MSCVIDGEVMFCGLNMTHDNVRGVNYFELNRPNMSFTLVRILDIKNCFSYVTKCTQTTYFSSESDGACGRQRLIMCEAECTYLAAA